MIIKLRDLKVTSSYSFPLAYGGGGKGEGVRIKSLTLLMTIMQIAIKGTMGRAVPMRLSNPNPV